MHLNVDHCYKHQNPGHTGALCMLLRWPSAMAPPCSALFREGLLFRAVNHVALAGAAVPGAAFGVILDQYFNFSSAASPFSLSWWAGSLPCCSFLCSLHSHMHGTRPLLKSSVFAGPGWSLVAVQSQNDSGTFVTCAHEVWSHHSPACLLPLCSSFGCSTSTHDMHACGGSN